VSWLEGGPQTVNEWREEAQRFIDMLQQRNDGAETDAELKALKERLKKLNELGTLRKLELSRAVTDEGLRELKELTALEALNLVSTMVTDAGLKELKPLKGLRELRILGAQITDAGLKNLEEIKSLTWLSIIGTKVTLRGLQRLRQRSLVFMSCTESGGRGKTGQQNREMVLAPNERMQLTGPAFSHSVV
jgi:hypothetical protein